MAATIRCCLFALLTLFAASSGLRANNYTPTTFADPPVSGAGVNVNTATGVITGGAGNGLISLRSATIGANANPGSTITLIAGTYQLTIPAGTETSTGTGAVSDNGNPAVGDLDIKASGLTIQGAGAATTIIQQTVSARVIDVNPVYAVGNFFFTIDGVTVTGGLQSADGGGILDGSNDTGLPTQGKTTVTNCIFKNNAVTGAGFGGGAIQHFGGDLLVSNCVFGGVGATDPNTSGTSGGAIAAIGYQAAAAFTISNCTFTNNVANSGSSGGGALDLVNINLGTATSVITNCTFTGNNAATASGGAIINESQPGATISKCTFVNNHAAGSGGLRFVIRHPAETGRSGRFRCAHHQRTAEHPEHPGAPRIRHRHVVGHHQLRLGERCRRE